MSLRPEEILRKAVSAGYGQPVSGPAAGIHEDDTCVLAVCEVPFDFGDWCAVHQLDSGHLQIRKATKTGDAAWCGVVQMKGAAGDWVKVKTAGTCIAKVKSSADVDPGDLIGMVSGEVYADELKGPSPCGRYLYRMGSADDFSWVSVGGTSAELVVHHHEDEKNTKISDVTVSTKLTAPLWHMFKVNDINFTGDPDARFMLAIGGATDHGESPKEGWGWGGVIGSPGALGFGQLGGNPASGNQGVLGAETAKSSEGTNYRINVRSWAGFNARDRYGAGTATVAPIRFSWCAGERAPKWVVNGGCDCVVGVTPGEACDASQLWWAGTMKLDGTFPPGGVTHTNWTKQWTPQLAIERNCCEAEYSAVTPPDFGCTIFTNPGAGETNAHDVSGAYEMLIPWGYTACDSRLDVLQAVCYHSEQIIALWRAMIGGFATVSNLLACMDAHLIALGQPACCGTVAPATIPVVSGGPAGSECSETSCDD